MKMDDKLMKLFYVTLVHEYNLVFDNFVPRNLEHRSYQGYGVLLNREPNNLFDPKMS